MTKKIVLTIMLLSTLMLTACANGDNSSDSASNSQPVLEESVETTPVSPEVAALAADGGLWEAINIQEGVTDYNGVTARVFNQWSFNEDGSCIFYLNGGPTEVDDFVFDEGSTTDFSIYVNGIDSGGQVLDFSYDGSNIYWNGDGFTMTFEKVAEHTTVSEEELNSAYGN